MNDNGGVQRCGCRAYCAGRSMTPEDEATAHLLVAAAFHDAAASAEERGDLSVRDFSRAVLRQFDEHHRLEGALYTVVMRYAQQHATPDEVASLHRWIAEVTVQ